MESCATEILSKDELVGDETPWVEVVGELVSARELKGVWGVDTQRGVVSTAPANGNGLPLDLEELKVRPAV